MPTDVELQELGKGDDYNSERFAEEIADREGLRADVESIGAFSKWQLDDDEDIKATLPLVEDLERLFPGREAPELLGTFRQLERTIEADQINGARAVEEWVANNLGSFAVRDEKSKPGAYGLIETKLKSGETVLAAEGSIRDELAKAVAQSGKADQLRAFKKQLGGRSLSSYVKEAIGFATEGKKNPAFAGSKLAVMKGAPLSAEQAQAQAERLATYHDAVRSNFVQINQLMETPEFMHLDGRQKDIEDVLRCGEVRPTGDLKKDLGNVSHVLEVRDGIGRMRKDPKNYPHFKEAMPGMIDMLQRGITRDVYAAYAKAAKQVASATIADDIRDAAKRRL